MNRRDFGILASAFTGGLAGSALAPGMKLVRLRVSEMARQTPKYQPQQIQAVCEIYINAILKIYHQRTDTGEKHVLYIVSSLLDEAVWKYTEQG